MYQLVVLIGRLGKDPEMKYLPNGDPVTTFSLATDRQWNDKQGAKQKETTWWRVSVWGKMADNANTYLSKGKLCLVQGRINIDSKTGGPRLWTGQDGVVHSSLEITAENIRFLSSKSEGEAIAAASGGGDEHPTSDGDIEM